MAAYGAALGVLARKRDPLFQAMIQKGLDLALFRLGEREAGTARLKEAALAILELAGATYLVEIARKNAIGLRRCSSVSRMARRDRHSTLFRNAALST
jgi:hypothetical protein